MDFRIKGLDPAPFAPLFSLSDAELAGRRALRKTSDAKPGFPCRITLRDAEPGESVLLLNYEHLPVESPYRASHAIYVSEAERPCDVVNEIPQALHDRLLAIRAFDERGLMIDADIAEGRDARPLIERLLALPDAAYLHAHYARRGCYAARIERAWAAASSSGGRMLRKAASS
jgi:hypothetical protein